jgi:Zn-dependent protease with chaperone function
MDETVEADEFARMVSRYEVEARQNPTRYRRKVAWWAFVGYAYVVAVVLALLALAADILSFGIHDLRALLSGLVVIGLILLPFLRSLFVRIEPPRGIELTPHQAPELFAVIDEVNASVQGRALDAVLASGDLNASVVQVPRFAVFGSHNYLVLGLPLMQTLPPGELRAVLAHELAHLSRSHGRFAVWLYRLQMIWTQLLTALARKTGLAVAATRAFFAWYVPRFNAHALPLTRSHELEADRIAAGAIGPDQLGNALSRLAVADALAETAYWPSVMSRAADELLPPASAISDFGSRLRDAGNEIHAEQWLESALARVSEPTDTHPSLSERLAAIGIACPGLTASESERGAERYLGDSLQSLSAQLDKLWREGVAIAWQAEYERAKNERTRLHELEVAPAR